MFAAGVILYILLCGYPPFNSKSVRQLFVRTVKGAYKLSGPEWDSISPEAKDLVRKMLDISPETRITTQEILAHPWITKAVDVAAEHIADSSPLGVDGLSARLYKSDLHGKSSVLHGHLLQKSVTEGAGDTAEEAEGLEGSEIDHQGGVGGVRGSSAADVNLSRALDHLADHIKVLKTEKLAKTVTRLMIAKHKAGGSKLAALYLVPYDKNRAIPTNAPPLRSTSQVLNLRALSMLPSMAPIAEEGAELDDPNHDSSSVASSTAIVPDTASAATASVDGGSSEDSPVPQSSAPVLSPTGNMLDELQQMMNSEAKEIVTLALFSYFGADEKHRLTFEQFVMMVKKFGLIGADTSIPSMEGPTSTSNVTSSIASVGLFGVLIAKFADKDNNGYITPEDFFTSQVLILQQNELYLRALFKQYQHSVWYPGRQANFNNAMKVITTANGIGTPATSPSVEVRKGGNTSSKLDIEFEPPPSITAKHVAAVFERFGYDPRAGQKVFSILCDALAKLNKERRMSSIGTSPASTPRKGSETRAGQDVNGPAAAEGPSTTSATSSGTSSVSNSEIVTGSSWGFSSTFSSLFGSTASKLGLSSVPDDTAALSTPPQDSPTPTSSSTAAADKVPVQVQALSEPGSPVPPSVQQQQQQTMDLNEFIHACQLDEVLVEIFSKDAHQRLFTLFQKAELKYHSQKELLERSDEPGAADKLALVLREEVALLLSDPNF